MLYETHVIFFNINFKICNQRKQTFMTEYPTNLDISKEIYQGIKINCLLKVYGSLHFSFLYLFVLHSSGIYIYPKLFKACISSFFTEDNTYNNETRMT